MSDARISKFALVVGITLLSSTLSTAGSGEYVDIKVEPARDHEVRYTSGNTIYVEGLVDGRWVGRYWTADGRINVPYELYSDDAFAIEANDVWLSHGWQWVGAHEEPAGRGGAKHFVVELKNTFPAVDLKIHTLVDGTPVLTRWLEIVNNSEKPEFLSGVYPWSSRLWRSADYRSSMTNATDPVFNLGYFTETGHGWEGWLRWTPLKDETAHIRYDVGTGSNDPFFIVRNKAEGNWFIGHLAWTANWDMEFKTDQDAREAEECRACAGMRACGSRSGPGRPRLNVCWRRAKPSLLPRFIWAMWKATSMPLCRPCMSTFVNPSCRLGAWIGLIGFNTAYRATRDSWQRILEATRRSTQG